MAFTFPTATSAPTGFTGFGAKPAASLGTGFGTSGFGTTTTTSSGFGSTFGSTTGGLGLGLGGFGATTTTNTGFTLGVQKPITSSSTFGTSLGGTSFNLGSKGLGSTTFGTSTGGLGTTGFGTGSGALGTTGFGATGGLGTTGFGSTGLGTGLGNTSFSLGGGLGGGTQDQSSQAHHDIAALARALSLPIIYNDERDGIIAKFNQLQAYWGQGKGYFDQTGHFVTFSSDNPFCCFKAIGYSCLPSAENEDGLVALEIKKKEKEVHDNQQALVDALQKLLGNKPNLLVCVEGLKQLPDDKTEVVFHIVERSPNGTSKKLLATDIYNFFNQKNIKTQLQMLGIDNVVTKTTLTPTQLKAYLESPPIGIDPILWEQAKKDNPDPQSLIPVPIIGFKELKRRLQHQEQETLQHQKRLEIISQDIANLQKDHATTMAKLAQFKRKHLELAHRVLEVMIKQECRRKHGYSIQADEEQLRVQLESLQVELNAPTQFKGRLNELMSQIRMQSQLSGARSDGTYSMEQNLQEEIKQHLAQQQDGIVHLIKIIKEDVQHLKVIEDGLVENVHQRRV